MQRIALFWEGVFVLLGFLVSLVGFVVRWFEVFIRQQ